MKRVGNNAAQPFARPWALYAGRKENVMTISREASVFKHYAQCALQAEYGFTAPLQKIVLLESHYDGAPQYVLFRVGGHEYRYDGKTLEKLS